MAHLYKTTTVRTVDADGKVVPHGTPGSKKKTEKSPKWYGKWVDSDGRTRSKALCKDKTAAQTMLNELVVRAERRQAGLIDPFEEHRRRSSALS